MSKNLFGISTLIMSIAFLIWSIGETFAYPQGPNVSLGSNPVFSRSAGYSTGNSNVVVFTNNTNRPAVITDLTLTGPWNYNCLATFYSSSGGSYRLNNMNIGSTSVHLSSGILVDSGATLTMNGNSRCTGAAISGYYTH